MIWEFPKIRGTLFWGPYNNEPTISGTILGSPIFGNSHLEFGVEDGVAWCCGLFEKEDGSAQARSEP